MGINKPTIATRPTRNIEMLSPLADGLHPIIKNYDRTAMTATELQIKANEALDFYNEKIKQMTLDMEWGSNRRDEQRNAQGHYHSISGPALISSEGYVFALAGIRRSLKQWLEDICASDKEKAHYLLKYT